MTKHFKRTKSKTARDLATHRIVYASRKYPHARHQELKVNLRRGTEIDTNYAVGLVATRTLLALSEIKIIRVESC